MDVVVVAVDGTPHSEAAFRKAIRLMPRESTDFHIVHVRPDPSDHALQEAFLLNYKHTEEVERRRREASEAVQEKFREIARSGELLHRVAEVQGDPRQKLLDYCAEHKATLLVLGSRGHGSLKRAFVGSVSDYCVTHATCAVMVNHAPEEKMEAAPSEKETEAA